MVLVRDYRMIACGISGDYTPSVMAYAMTAPPTQGSLWLVQTGSPYFDFYDSVIVSWRAGHAAAPTMPCREIFEKPTFPIPQKPACGGNFPHRRVFLLHFIASLPFPVVF